MARTGREAQGQADPLALQAAQIAQQAAHPSTVILFGSRARGDHRPDSDIDLLLVTPPDAPPVQGSMRKASREFLAQHSVWLDIDIVTFTVADLEYYRHSRNHVVAQALREGVIMTEGNLHHRVNYDDEYTNDWPDIKQRLRNTNTHLRAMSYIPLGVNEDDQELVGFHAQQTIENAMKGWISTIKLTYRTRHELQPLYETIMQKPDQADSPAGRTLQEFMEFTRDKRSEKLPEDDGSWLSQYAVKYRYNDTHYAMNIEELEEFFDRTVATATAIIEHIHQLTQTDHSDLQRLQIPDWDRK